MLELNLIRGGSPVRLCKRCHTVKPRNNFSPARLHSCHECEKKAAKEYRDRHPGKAALDSARWRSENPERRIEMQRAYCEKRRGSGASKRQYWANPERRRAQSREWGRKHSADRVEYRKKYYAENKETLRAKRLENIDAYRSQQAEYRRKNKDKINAKTRAWYEANRDRARRVAKEWIRNNRDKALAAKMNRRALESRAHGLATAAQIRARVEFYGGRCAYCGSEYSHIDHVIPLARGGTNWPSNLRPACESCNKHKWTLGLSEFLNRLHAINREVAHG